MHIWAIVIIGLLIALYLLVQWVRCRLAVKHASLKLLSYGARAAELSFGKMTYVDEGAGEAILCSHGIFGGYDQAFDTCRDYVKTNRIISPSRFGYLGSDILGDGTPKEQAQASVELLDFLGVEKVYILGTSAGGTVAIRFALDYPERTKGLILYCSAPPLTQKPDKYVKRQGPPPPLINNYAMFILSPLFNLVMGMNPTTIYSMLPINKRRTGVEIDATITNPDMAKNFSEYRLEELHAQTLIFHAKDDRLVNYYDMEKSIPRFPRVDFVSFETGGHLMTGHSADIKIALEKFQASNNVS